MKTIEVFSRLITEQLFMDIKSVQLNLVQQHWSDIVVSYIVVRKVVVKMHYLICYL